MTKALSSYPAGEREAVAKRRIAKKTGGLGYLSALAFMDAVKRGKKIKLS